MRLSAIRHESNVLRNLPPLAPLVLVVMVAFAPAADAELIYWTEGGELNKVRRVRLDGTDIRDVAQYTPPDLPLDIAVDPQGGKVYWALNGAPWLQWADIDGSDVHSLTAPGLSHPRNIALDPGGRYLYWMDSEHSSLNRMTVDGAGTIEVLVGSGVSSSHGLAVDPGGGKVYWTDPSLNDIRRANLDGSGVGGLGLGLGMPRGVAVDPAGGKLYWADSGTNKIQRCNVDGSGLEDVVSSGVRNPGGVALDLGHGKVYWTNGWSLSIMRANLDGSGGLEDVVSDLVGMPWALCVYSLVATSSVTATTATTTGTTSVTSATSATATASSVTATSTSASDSSTTTGTTRTTTHTTTTATTSGTTATTLTTATTETSTTTATSTLSTTATTSTTASTDTTTVTTESSTITTVSTLSTTATTTTFTHTMTGTQTSVTASKTATSTTTASATVTPTSTTASTTATDSSATTGTITTSVTATGTATATASTVTTSRTRSATTESSTITTVSTLSTTATTTTLTDTTTGTQTSATASETATSATTAPATATSTSATASTAATESSTATGTTAAPAAAAGTATTTATAATASRTRSDTATSVTTTATLTTIAHTSTTSDTATTAVADTHTSTTRAGVPCPNLTGTAGLETLKGMLTMTAGGVSSAQVEVAVKLALRVAFGLCEGDSLSVSADEVQRSGARRLVADLWRVAYEITVPGEKTETVRSTADAIQSNGTYFSLALERAFMEAPDVEWSAQPPPQVESFTELALVMVGSGKEPGASDGDTRVSGVSSVMFSLSLLLVSATCFVGSIIALALYRKHFMQQLLEVQRLQSPKNSRCVVVGACHTPKKATPRGFHRDVVEHIKVKPCPHPSEALVLRDAEDDDDIPSIEPSPSAQTEPRTLSKASAPPPLEIHADDAAPTPRPMAVSTDSGLRAVAARSFGPDCADFLDRPPERQSRGYRNRTISPANFRPTAPSPGGRRAHGRRLEEEEDVFPPAPAKPSSALRRASRGAKAKPPETPGLPERTGPAWQEAAPPQAAELQLEDINWSPRSVPRENPRQAVECWVEKEVDTDPTASTTSCTPVDAERWSPGAPAFLSRGPAAPCERPPARGSPWNARERLLAPCERPPARGSPWNARERPQRPGKIIVQCLEEVDCDTLAASPRGPTDHFPKGDVDLASTCAVFWRGGPAEGRGHEPCADEAALVATPPSHKALRPQEKAGYVTERPLSPEPVVEKLRLKEVQLTPRSKKKNPGGRRIVIG